jgi:hypothetical protein
LASAPISGGVSLNVGSAQEFSMVSIEVSGTSGNVLSLTTNYSHFNQYKHLPTQYYLDPSSAARQATAW